MNKQHTATIHSSLYHWQYFTHYLLVNHCLTRWAVTFCPTYGDCRAAIKHFQVGFFTLSSWFSHASITCHPNSSSDSSLLRVDDFNPNLRPSLRYLLTVRSDSCSRTSSRSSLAIKDNIIHELMIIHYARVPTCLTHSMFVGLPHLHIHHLDLLLVLHVLQSWLQWTEEAIT